MLLGTSLVGHAVLASCIVLRVWCDVYGATYIVLREPPALHTHSTRTAHTLHTHMHTQCRCCELPGSDCTHREAVPAVGFHILGLQLSALACVFSSESVAICMSFLSRGCGFLSRGCGWGCVHLPSTEAVSVCQWLSYTQHTVNLRLCLWRSCTYTERLWLAALGFLSSHFVG